MYRTDILPLGVTIDRRKLYYVKILSTVMETLLTRCEYYVRSGDTYKLDSAYKKKTVIAMTNFTLSFFYQFAADRDTLFAALVLPPECLGEVRRRAISRTPLLILLGGLLSEGESGQLSLRLRRTHQQ
jgi:hypothetical protein